jgi:hypothetical protein
MSEAYQRFLNVTPSTDLWDSWELVKRHMPIEQPPSTASYIVFIKGDKCYAKNGMTGHIEFGPGDAATVIQSAINALTSGGKIFIKAGTYVISNVVIINQSNLFFVGEYGATILKFNVDYPVKFRTVSNIVFEDLVFKTDTYFNSWFFQHTSTYSISNVTFRRCIFTGYAGYNIFILNWSTDPSLLNGFTVEQCIFKDLIVKDPTKDIGVDQDTAVIAFLGNNAWFINNCFDNVTARRGINVLRTSSKNIFIERNTFKDFKAISSDGHPIIVDRGQNVVISNNVFYWTTNPTYRVEANILIEIGGSQQVMDNIVIQGNTILSDVSFSQILHGIYVHGIYVSPNVYLPDKVSIVGNTIKGVYSNGIVTGYGLLNSVIEGNVIAEIGNCGIFFDSYTNNVIVQGNLIRNVNRNNASYSEPSNTGSGIVLRGQKIKVLGNSITNDTPYMYYGINELSGANYNIIEGNRVEGFQTSAIRKQGANTTVKFNVGYVTENSGTATFSGNGTTTVFTIAHGLAGTPKSYRVEAGSADAKGDKYVTADATNLTVTFATAPPTGTNNVVLVWSAEM